MQALELRRRGGMRRGPGNEKRKKSSRRKDPKVGRAKSTMENTQSGDALNNFLANITKGAKVPIGACLLFSGTCLACVRGFAALRASMRVSDSLLQKRGSLYEEMEIQRLTRLVWSPINWIGVVHCGCSVQKKKKE